MYNSAEKVVLCQVRGQRRPRALVTLAQRQAAVLDSLLAPDLLRFQPALQIASRVGFLLFRSGAISQDTGLGS